MPPLRDGVVRSFLIPGLVFSLWFSVANSTRGAGVTLITHGLNGNVDGWITSMADQIPSYYRFPGTNFTCYELYFFQSGSNYFLTSTRTSGSSPLSSDSGEIIVKLDWRQLADGNSYNTYQVASAVVPALLSTNFISELNGHALAEFPLHLIGHSRGGSLVCELSRQLGTNGVWIDHLTTLDPHPLNNDGFTLDSLLYSDVDAPARTYSNVLFHDNYWQNASFPIYGEPVSGAYTRQLTNFSGGYSGTGRQHSDVHLWYHGTVDTNIPASYVEDGTTISITSAMRTNWWNNYETKGAAAGFRYSLIGGGNRLSTDHPLGGGTPAIFDGYNQRWDLGAGTSTNNRTSLPANNGSWPNLIRFDRLETNSVVQGQSTLARFYYQWAQPTNNSAIVEFFIDDDFNPLNGNQKSLGQLTISGSTPTNVPGQTVSLTLNATNASPGYHSLLVRISAGDRSRYLYAPEWVQVVAPSVSTNPPTLSITQAAPDNVVLSWPPDHIGWRLQVQTNTLDVGMSGAWSDVTGSTSVNVLTNGIDSAGGAVFYRLIYP